MSAKAPKIIVTIDEGTRTEATPRVRALLKEAGAPQAVILRDAAHGTIHAWVPGDPRPVVGRLQALFERDPARFHGTHRWLPVESWAQADPRDLSAYAALFRRRLGDKESWKVEVRKHDSQVSTHELIKNIASLIDQPNVALENPDRTLFVHALGDRLGFADVARGQVFDTNTAGRGREKPGPWSPPS
jgi:hypothetical protein